MSFNGCKGNSITHELNTTRHDTTACTHIHVHTYMYTQLCTSCVV